MWAITIKADLDRKSLVNSHRTVEPRVHLSKTWSAQLVMPAQPAPSEYRHK